MKLGLDFLALLTDSRDRGIGRYTLNLAEALFRTAARSTDLVGYWDAADSDRLRNARINLRSRGVQIETGVYHYPSTKTLNHLESEQLTAGCLKARFFGEQSVDIVLFSSLFEFSDTYLADLAPRKPGDPLRAVVAYDLIPLLFPERYLPVGSAVEIWYRRTLESFCAFDLFLAISETTKKDLVELLGIEASRIIVIGTGLDPLFRDPFVVTDQQRDSRLTDLGIRGPFIFVVGNGDWRKNNLGALQAFSRLPKDLTSRYQLVFTQVGPDVSEFLANCDARLQSQVLVLGRITDYDLILLNSSCYLSLFPSFYEGFGLPVIEAMALGAAVLASSAGAIGEVVPNPEQLFNPHDPQELLGKLVRVLSDANYRDSLRSGAVEHAHSFLWDQCAKLVWRSVNSIVLKHSREYYDWDYDPSEISFFADAVVSGVRPSWKRLEFGFHSVYSQNRRVFIDITEVALNDAKTGIQRVVRSFTQHLVQIARRVSGLSVVPLRWDSGRFVHARAFAREALGLDLQGSDEVFQACPGDLLFMADSSWANPERFYDTFDEVHRAGGEVVGCLYDMIPIYHSQYCHEGIPPFFKNWLDKVMGRVDGFICISESTETDLLKYLDETWEKSRQRPWTMACHLGADAVALPIEKPTADVTQMLSGLEGHPVFLALSTVEPRKNYQTILDAFEIVWKTRPDIVLVIVGKEGWNVADLAARLRTHPRKGKSLFWFERANDADIHLIMTRAYALIQASFAEGFGLALVEAASLGVPLILSSLPVFHEVVGDQASFFAPNDQAGLARLILDPRQLGPQPCRMVVPTLTWDEATRNLLSALTGLKAPGVKTSRILVDVSEVVRLGAKGGIQRVVRNYAVGIFDQWTASGGTVELIRWTESGFRFARRFARDELGLNTQGPDLLIDVLDGDCVFMVDSSWWEPQRFDGYFQAVKKQGGRVVAMVYDLIPITHPETCAPGMTEAFTNWLSHATTQVDEFICISRATQDELKAHLSHRRVYKTPRISWVHIGCDLTSANSDERSQICDHVLKNIGERPFAVSIGTIEPRKGHATILDAFDLLWSSGKEMCLVLIGKSGWNVDSLVKRIREHRKLGKSLFWLEASSDSDIVAMLEKAWVLVQASHAEGFGLPLVEAGARGVPLIASDLMVFREILGDHARWFATGNSEDLAEKLKAILGLPESYRTEPLLAVKWFTSTEILLKHLVAYQGSQSASTSLNEFKQS